MIRALLLVLLMIPVSVLSYGQHLRDSSFLYYDSGEWVIDEAAVASDSSSIIADISLLVSNKQHFSDVFCDVVIDSILVTSYASPLGGTGNKALSSKRATELQRYLSLHTGVPTDRISSVGVGIDWSGLRSLVYSSDMRSKFQILDIIDSVPEETWADTDAGLTLVDSRNKHLMDLGLGLPYEWMDKNLFSTLRRSSIIVKYRVTPSEFKALIPVAYVDSLVVDTALHVVPAVDIMPAVNMADSTAVDIVPTVDMVDSTAVDIVSPTVTSKSSFPTFAIKTNLLFYALFIPNIEVEVPIGDRWSVQGEWMFPWWITKDNGNALQVLAGGVEGRYWLGSKSKRSKREFFTGHFVGIYGGGGMYDIQYQNNGYQGEFYIAAGVSYGYGLRISNHFNVEFSLGIGALMTNYRAYEGEEDNKYLVWKRNGQYQWFGPTKAKISLVWLLGGKKRRGL